MSTSKSTPKPILEALKKALSSGPAEKLQDSFYKPRPQQYHYHNGKSWTVSSQPVPPQSSQIDTKSLRLISWNIDMLIGFAEERMSAALTHLSNICTSTPSQIPLVIFLQEMTQSDIRQITEATWVRQRFYLTDINTENWPSPLYGTTALIDRRLYIDEAFRVPWISKFDRDGLFVDIALSLSQSTSSIKDQEEAKVLRLCNTHLESLIADPPIRPIQLQAAASYLHDAKVAASLFAGDLNAIQPFDRALHSENGLKDAYLQLGGKEDSDEGYTWGYQVPQAVREQFGCSRMDKILFAGNAVVKGFERIGMGVKVEGKHGKEMRDAGEEEWVSDHYGVKGDVRLENGWEIAQKDEHESALKSKV